MKSINQLFTAMMLMAYIQMLVRNVGGSKRSMGECWWTAKDQRGFIGVMDQFSDSLKFILGDDS